MENADRAGVMSMPVDRGLADARAMLLKRDPEGQADAVEEPFHVDGVPLLWSFVRGGVAAAAVEVLNKHAAAALIAAAEEAGRDLVAIYRAKRTNDGRRVFEEYKGERRIENWRMNRLYLNVMRLKFCSDVGVVRKADITPELLERIGGNSADTGETYETDPIPRYLDARVGDLTWTDNHWGTLESSRDYRVVITSKTAPKLFAS